MEIRPLSREEREVVDRIFTKTRRKNTTILFAEMLKERTDSNSKILAAADGRVESASNLYF